MVQTALDMVTQVLLGFRALGWPLLGLLGALALALLLLGLLDRARFTAALGWLGARGRPLGRWMLALLALGAGVLALTLTRQAVNLRLGSALNARYSNAADPDVAPTDQPAPQAALIGEHTYVRSLTLPPSLLRRLDAEGVQVLAPYLDDPSSDNISSLRDRFSRSGQDVVFTREATLETATFLPLTSSGVRAELNFASAGNGRDFYNASFSGQYVFRNPQTVPATLRFTFPLPQGSGTLSGFQMLVDGVPVQMGDLSDGSIWQGVVPAGGAVTVAVRYQHQGSRGWSYSVSRQREPVQAFDLSVQTNRPARFPRYSLYPTSITGGSFGQPQTLRWQLRNAITSQDVSVVFAQGSLRETLAKLHFFAPLALTLGALLLLLYAGPWLPRLSPLRLALALLGLSLGWVLGGLLTAYLPAALAEVLGALAGLGLGLACLGRRFLPPLIIVAASPLSFLWVGNAGLLLGVLALMAAGLLLRRVQRVRPAVQGPTAQG